MAGTAARNDRIELAGDPRRKNVLISEGGGSRATRRDPFYHAQHSPGGSRGHKSFRNASSLSVRDSKRVLELLEKPPKPYPGADRSGEAPRKGVSGANRLARRGD